VDDDVLAGRNGFESAWDSGPVDAGLELLDTPECFALAASRPVGRVAVSVGALPAVFPVNFCLLGNDVVFRTASGTKLAAAMDGAVVAFEVDDFDVLGHRGWSVMVVGEASEILARDLAALEPLPVHPWAHGVRDHVVRIRSQFVTGRRITFAPDGDRSVDGPNATGDMTSSGVR
jgi:hypothetical protein